MISRLHISSFIALTIAAWLLALWVQGITVLSLEFVRPFSLVVGIIGGIVAVFVKWGWAWSVFRGWYVRRPDIRGTWEATLQSNWINPETDEGIPPITGYISVRQTLIGLSLRLMTSESRSRLVAHSIELEDDGIYRVAAIYRNEPRVELQGDRSEIHYGSLLLEVYGTPPDSMEGHYWTDRSTRGTMKISRRRKQVRDTFESALALYQDSAQ